MARPQEPIPGSTYNGFSTPVAASAGRRDQDRADGRDLRGAAGAAAIAAAGLLAGGLAFGTSGRFHAPRPSPVATPQAAAPPAPGPLEPAPVRPVARVTIPAPPGSAPSVRAQLSEPHAPPRAVRPAFHCDWRLRRSERMVCSDPALAQLDRRLNHAFGEAVRAGVPRAALRREQDRWVIRREAVARRSRAALVRYYVRRIDKLEALARRGRP